MSFKQINKKRMKGYSSEFRTEKEIKNLFYKQSLIKNSADFNKAAAFQKTIIPLYDLPYVEDHSDSSTARYYVNEIVSVLIMREIELFFSMLKDNSLLKKINLANYNGGFVFCGNPTESQIPKDKLFFYPSLKLGEYYEIDKTVSLNAEISLISKGVIDLDKPENTTPSFFIELVIGAYHID